MTPKLRITKDCDDKYKNKFERPLVEYCPDCGHVVMYVYFTKLRKCPICDWKNYEVSDE